ncbi:TetR family transcriptional regulator [Luteococcus japonicus]|uniref:TetR family transcriptional regulator n=1 Tax=Luteococcus japonicus TaxID=33984 RepID=A0A3N1ZRZ8_9ACTN|nr:MULTISPECIES: TetR/AcrR family transcriptional regulator [Luteococcus]MDN5562855.1 TetR/AcrR family transcriptional regulator [Luteococcus sp.]ROR53656.1 TetR family transcriptional regulator [Luteococcus japonicus]
MDTRERLVRAAQESFAVRGYDATSIRRLAQVVGIKESSVYKHFRSKEEILAAVLDRARDQMESTAAGLQVSFTDPTRAADQLAGLGSDSLLHVAQALMDAWLHDPDVVVARRVLTLEQYRTPEVGRRLRDWMVNDAVAHQSILFAALMEQGLFLAADPRAVALAFWGPVLAILIAAEAGDEELARERLRLHVEHFTTTHVVERAAS